MNSYDRYLQRESEEWNEAYEISEEDYSDQTLNKLATKMFSKYIKKDKK